jgi:hypothetical protein
MKRGMFLVLITTCAGGALGQVVNQKTRSSPNYQSHRPLGANSLPVPHHRKDDVALGTPPEQP